MERGRNVVEFMKSKKKNQRYYGKTEEMIIYNVILHKEGTSCISSPGIL